LIEIACKSVAFFSQVDLLASFASLTGEQLSVTDAPDSFDELKVLTGKSAHGRDFVIEHANPLSIIKGNWKYIEPNSGEANDNKVHNELGNSLELQLYDLSNDIGEKKNLYKINLAKTKELAILLYEVKSGTIKRVQ
jgi:arylsulfatase A